MNKTAASESESTQAVASRKRANATEISLFEDHADDSQDNSPILVSEFPPPPYYYTLFHSLKPPEIPTQSFIQVSRHVESLIASSKDPKDDGLFPTKTPSGFDTHGDSQTIDINTLPAVFGEIVEDPLHMHVEDICEDPSVVRNEILRLVLLHILFSKHSYYIYTPFFMSSSLFFQLYL